MTFSSVQINMARKWPNLLALALAELLAMSLWFSASAVVPQLTAEWGLSSGQQAWMTMSVQIGFVTGALLSAFYNVADRIPARRLFALSALTGALLNGAIPLFAGGPALTLSLRFLTGLTLAGVYPPGMKLMTTWCREDRGLGIGILVGALTLGSALPHLLNALPVFGAGGLPPWRAVLLATSALALLAAAVVWTLVTEGPFAVAAARFHWRYASESFTNPATRLANFGYLGHMWELYAMWAWLPLFLIASYERAGWTLASARLAGFAVIAIGAVGCVGAGHLADRLGRTTIAVASLLVSGGCALVVGAFFDQPAVATGLALLWGFAVVADSAQFSAAISELADRRYVGTALTVQTSAGFLLTLFTIQMIPPMVAAVGWERAFWLLALGPLFGIWSMFRLRQLPEARRMASGNR